MILLYVFTGLLILSYLFLVINFIRGWNVIPEYQGTNTHNTSVTVIIAFRNEESTLSCLLEKLKHQDYPLGKWNIIFVNDHSTDKSVEILKAGINGFNSAVILNLPEGLSGKKSALAFGAQNTGAELLIFTDADCLPGKKWISSIVSGYERYLPVLISAPVIMEYEPDFFSRFQALEFLSLVGSGAASFGQGNPIMLNGANLAVRRDIYIENQGLIKNRVTSGDDIFILLGLKKKYPGGLIFLKCRDAIIRTFPLHGLRSFFSQRIRWVSKARYYRDLKLIATAILVFMVNFLLMMSLVFGIFIPRYLLLFGCVFILKSAVDYIFLRKVADFTGQRELLKYLVFSQAIYFLYTGITGFIGNFVSYRWKERKICK